MGRDCPARSAGRSRTNRAACFPAPASAHVARAHRRTSSPRRTTGASGDFRSSRRACTSWPSSCRRVRPYRGRSISDRRGRLDRRPVVLRLAGVAQSVTVTASRASNRARAGSKHGSGRSTCDIPTRRYSMFDLIRAAPGVSPTSPSSGTINTVSVVRIGRQRERVSHRRHELHVSVPGRVARRAERGRHSGNAGAVDGRVGRVRQHAGRRLQRRHQARRRLGSSRARRTTGRRPG